MKASWVKQYGSLERVRAIQRMLCPICFHTPCENAHIKSRGAGGTYLDIIPLCPKHHHEFHQIGINSFQKKYNINLIKIADRVVKHLT